MKNYLKIACIAGSMFLSNSAVGDIIITEIMQNPAAVADADGEWFEVYNTGGSTVDLVNWSFQDTGLDFFTVIGSLPIDPNEYLVFGNNSNTATNGNVAVDYQYTGFTLGNAADEIDMYDIGGFFVDSVAYDGGPSFPDPTGASMELSLSAYNSTANDLGSNWNTATTAWAGGDLGTPGASPVPVPAAVWLFGSGLLGFVGMSRRGKGV
jgi:hypothetical protein